VVPEWSVAGRAAGGKHQVLPASIPTTAALLSAKGYDTAHFQSNPNATREHGIEQGFHHYYYELNAGYEAQTTAFIEWLRTEAREPFYAYIHLIDPHEPYSPDAEIFRQLHGHTIEEYLARLPEAEYRRMQNYHRQTWDGLFKSDRRPGPDVLANFSPSGLNYMEALYTAEIRGMDGQFGRMLAALDEQGLRERCIVTVTSDHGEAFGEDGLFYHGSGLHDAQIHVPLILQLPGMLRAARHHRTVSQYDIHPTLLTLAGIPDPKAYGNIILNRDGLFPQEPGRPALTSLDLNEPDPEAWRFRLTAGNIRVESLDEYRHCRVSRAGGRGTPELVALEEVATISDAAIREAVEFFYTERHYLRELSEAHEAPDWHEKETSDQETLKALGYL
jgi:arylsulfatase A-like enzyme